MRPLFRIGLMAASAASLAACGGGETVEVAPPPPPPPYKPVATVVDLMRATVELSAEVYWGSVSFVVDAEGEHENKPETDLEWIEVWGAAMTLAESGNLLMMPPRALDQGEWMRLSTDLVDVGLRAAQIASDRDFEGMLAVGEEIYNVCDECHTIYVPTLPPL